MKIMIIMIFLVATLSLEVKSILIHPASIFFEEKNREVQLALCNPNDYIMNYTIENKSGIIIDSYEGTIDPYTKKIINFRLISYSSARTIRITDSSKSVHKSINIPIKYGKYIILFPSIEEKKEYDSKYYDSKHNEKKGLTVMFSIPFIGVFIYSLYSFTVKGKLF
jgi:hypothetical protein